MEIKPGLATSLALKTVIEKKISSLLPVLILGSFKEKDGEGWWRSKGWDWGEISAHSEMNVGCIVMCSVLHWSKDKMITVLKIPINNKVGVFAMFCITLHPYTSSWHNHSDPPLIIVSWRKSCVSSSFSMKLSKRMRGICASPAEISIVQLSPSQRRVDVLFVQSFSIKAQTAGLPMSKSWIHLQN